MTTSSALDALNFDNSFVRELPADAVAANQRRQVRGACFSRVQPSAVSAPKLIGWSSEVAALLGIDREQVGDEALAQIFAGNRLAGPMEPYAACYGGHQFGNWAGQLGDGRAITLGEVVNADAQRWEMQLKGAGPTPYSRTADGRAVLRSSVREFLCSEAMFHLGVPTTRALSLVLTGDLVVRDMFYDGHPAPEPGAIVCRVAPSFLRFGSFEIFASRGELDVLRTLADYTISHHFAELGPPGPAAYVAWFDEVCRRTAVMVAHWMRVGFVHGVMNTDNMSVLGLTIDYGPYGWLEDFNPGWTPNTTDASHRRYRFGNQPQIAHWNLAQLGNALYDLVGEVEPLQAALATYVTTYEQQWREMIAAKLGLLALQADDQPLVDELMDVLQLVETDMTIFYRKLAELDVDAAEQLDDRQLLEPLLEAYYAPDELAAHMPRVAGWLRRYAARLKADGRTKASRLAAMNAVNPKYVPRNYLAQLAIDASEKGDHGVLSELHEVLKRPYDEQPSKEHLAGKRPDWARSRPGCSMLSCSS
ncbi:MAG: YdiU family protein [Bradymonadaceae bacterium]|nr:YdiU family protein [Lujinxingiaceae bacterium]